MPRLLRTMTKELAGGHYFFRELFITHLRTAISERFLKELALEDSSPQFSNISLETSSWET